MAPIPSVDTIQASLADLLLMLLHEHSPQAAYLSGSRGRTGGWLGGRLVHPATVGGWVTATAGLGGGGRNARIDRRSVVNQPLIWRGRDR